MSEDAVVGSDQKGEVFYHSINDFYGTLRPSYYAKRDIKSVERRVRKILAEHLSFAGCVAKMHNTSPSGTTYEDIIHLATAL